MAESLTLAANCAASALMLLAFLVLLAGTVVLYSVVRALRATRRALPEHASTARRVAEEASLATRHGTDAVVRPHIAAASAWAGIRAGAKALIRSGDPVAAKTPPSMSQAAPRSDAQPPSRASTAPKGPDGGPASE